MNEAGGALPALEAELAEHHLRGQWQGDAERALTVTKGAQGQIYAEPVGAGLPHIWRWRWNRFSRNL